MKILTFTTLYPNNVQFRHGIFIEQRMRHWFDRGQIALKVVAPVPWFPFKAKQFGAYGDYARVAKQENRFGIDVYHPRYPVIPKVGMNVAPALLAAATLPVVKSVITNGFNFDVIDAHYFYPDGVAAAIIAKALNKPLVISARGSDVHHIPHYVLPKKMILWAAQQADEIITVCEALKVELINLGVPASKSIHALRNGVDLQTFCPKDRQSIRKSMGLNQPTLVSVGNLIELKGHHLIIEAMLQLPSFQLLIVGGGPELGNLQALVKQYQLADRVQFLGTLTHQQLSEVYNAADALVLASSREGWANVLLEAMACGTPVVATNIWGTPEVVRSADAGVLIEDRSADGIALGIKALFAQYPDRQKTRRYAEGFSWDETTSKLNNVYATLINNKITS